MENSMDGTDFPELLKSGTDFLKRCFLPEEVCVDEVRLENVFTGEQAADTCPT